MKHGALRDMYREHTREASWGRGSFGSQNPAEDSKVQAVRGFYLA